ncbi:unnamed protein product, partial [Ectocarpus sp. 12 AP-2014]
GVAGQPLSQCSRAKVLLLQYQPKWCSGPVRVKLIEFFRTNYAELKTLNPGFPILLREGTGADPYLLATYDYGVEHRLSLSGLSQENIAKEVEKAVEKGSSLPLSPMQPSFRSASAGAVEA